jgi:hypothetical protein
MKKLIVLATALPLVMSLGCAQDDKKSDAQPAPAAQEKSAPPPATAKGDRGNWDVIDKNNDNYIQAEEMESWLKANPGPGSKK